MNAACAILFHTKVSKLKIEHVVKELEANGFSLNEESHSRQKYTIIYRVAAADRKHIERMAELQGVVKRVKLTGKMEPFTRRNAAVTFEDYEKPTFFTASEEMFLLQELLYRVRTTEAFNEVATDKSQRVTAGDELIACAKQFGIIDEILPLHTEQCQQIWKKHYYDFPLSAGTIDSIQSYYGAKVALYFAWMRHFTLWLVGPGIFGLIISVRNRLDSSTSIDNSLLAPLFTIAMIIWSALFLRFWQRTESHLTCEWGTIGHNATERMRCEFEGSLRVSEITGLNERYFPYYLRASRYVGSAAVTCAMLFVAACVMVLSLNLQGYIHVKSFGSSILHFPLIHQFSMPGSVFDQQGEGPYPMFLPFVPTILHSVIIFQLNSIYRSIATRLTDWENHRTMAEYENALVLKRFFFEAFDCYIALFYLAFFESDILLLQAELVSLYTVDTIRRVVTESALPLFFHYATSKHEKKQLKSVEKDDEQKTSENVDTLTIEEQFKYDEYEQFDDYIEMVIEFGYVMLFASAYPLAAGLSIISNLFEAKSDFFKLSYVTRRPDSIPSDNIGVWFTVMKVLMYMSTITNVFIFGFTTEQMMQLFPSFFRIEASRDVDFGGVDHTHVVSLGMGRWVVGIVFLIEHVMILLIQLIFIMIPSQPEHVKNEVMRRELHRGIQLERRILESSCSFTSRENKKNQ